MQNKPLIMILVLIAVIAVGAAANAYMGTKDMRTDKQIVETKTESKSTATANRASKAQKEKITWNEPSRQVNPAPQTAQQQQVKRCDDGNIVGAALGAAGGGLVGNQFGKGKGNDLATIGGVIAGGVAGHQMIPTRGVLCR